MKSHSSISSDVEGNNSNESSFQGLSLTTFGETKNLRDHERANNDPILALDGNVEGRNCFEQHAAIVCRNVKKWYNKEEPVLSDLNMRVPSGSVYALLGSSGCGKTTLLSCILGMSTLNKGSILVYGENAGKNNIGIPGRNVGFMPQQISLYPEFTIWETFNYFASFAGLTRNQCISKADFFTLLLRLPHLDRKVGTLSGGQQRRVSFAATLIHEPPLLILDEPTVGIDPIVRHTMWNYIEKLATTKTTTIIITTHYIEEARRANIIGVMRQGRILLEQSPQQLIENFNSTSLEKAVLQLFKSGLELPEHARSNTFGETPNIPANSSRRPEPYDEAMATGYRMATVKTPETRKILPAIGRIKALTYKNFIVMFRNIFLLSFIIWIPAAEILISNIAFKFNPSNLKIGVINHESTLSICNSIVLNKTNCSLENLSCQYLATVNPNFVELLYFDTSEDAEAAVHSGRLRGYLVFSKDFSQNLYAKATYGASVSESVYNSTIVIGRFDETNKPITISVKLELYRAIEEFLSTVLSSCGLDPRKGSSPLQYGTPIYGKENMDLREFVLSGVAIAMTYFFPIIVMGTRFIEERNCGMLTRSFVAGVKSWEIFISYLFSECWVLIVQGVLACITIVFVAGIDIIGSVWLALALLLLNGYCGTSFGILLGSVSREKVDVGILSIAFFMPNIYLTGLSWPIEGMPEALKYVAHILPCTLPALSMRSIITRGLEFFDDDVWPGFAVLFVHIIIYSVLTMVYQRFKYSK